MSFQWRVARWCRVCFGVRIATDVQERNLRFIEEAIELVQSLGLSKKEVQTVVDYVYSREGGSPRQEVGGVMVTLAALCEANNMNMVKWGEVELLRCYENLEKIRAKHSAKPENVRIAP